MNNQKKKTSQIIMGFTKKVVDMEPEYADRIWKVLEQAIYQIYNNNINAIIFQERYSDAYNMVLYKYGEKLYSGFVTTTSAHLKEISKSIDAAQGGSFLEELNRKWIDHNQALPIIRDMLNHMDRTFVPSTHKTPVCELGLNLWRDNVIRLSNIQTRLLNTLLELILRERTGEVINQGMMRNIVKMLIDLGGSVYQEDFEKPFLEVSGNFYRFESQQLIECCDCGVYLKRAERRLNEEIERVSHYLDPNSEPKITNVVETEMIANHMLRLVHMENSGLVKMLLDDKYDDLGRMYSLLKRIPNGLNTIRDVMTSRIGETCKQLASDQKMVIDRVEFVQCLSDGKVKYDKIISLAFNNDETFQNALSTTFEFFINWNPLSPGLFIPKLERMIAEMRITEDRTQEYDEAMMLN